MSRAAFRIGNRSIGRDDATYIIAEIGQNHQGDIEVAKRMISAAKNCGADCVKFQKSHLPAKFTADALLRPYRSANAWAATYGDHKRYLEFSLDQYRELQAYANEVGIAFTASAMDEVSLEQLVQLRVPFVKIGSGDGNNYAMLQKAVRSCLPLVVSTGMQKEATVRRVVEILKGSDSFCVMHCVSAYPTPPEHATLRLIEVYREWFPDICLGYSGHEQGIWISVAAVLLGAKVIERHFTLDKTQKGTDHALSLEPDELTALVSAIRQIDQHKLASKLANSSDASIIDALGTLDGFNNQKDASAVELALKPIATKKILNCELECFNKLGKSLVFRGHLSAGTRVAEHHLIAKVSEPRGIPADRIDEFVGQQLAVDVDEDDLVRDICFKAIN